MSAMTALLLMLLAFSLPLREYVKACNERIKAERKLQLQRQYASACDAFWRELCIDPCSKETQFFKKEKNALLALLMKTT